MMLDDFEPKISVSLTNYFRGQKSMTMTVKIGNETVAAMDFREYDGEPGIEWIHVDEEYRRRGLGKLMISELQRMYPDQEIDWGATTPEGTRLYTSIPHRNIPKPDVISRIERLNKVKRRLKRLERKLETMPDDMKSKWIQTVGDRWNQFHDMVSKLERELGSDYRTHKKIVDLKNG